MEDFHGQKAAFPNYVKFAYARLLQTIIFALEKSLSDSYSQQEHCGNGERDLKELEIYFCFRSSNGRGPFWFQPAARLDTQLLQSLP